MRAHEIGGGEAQHALLDQIHRSVLEECQDVGCADVLSSCADKAGVMSKADALAFLRTPLLCDRVHDEIVIARTERGVVGLPFTVIDDKWAVSGGQSADVYEQVSFFFVSSAVLDVQRLRRLTIVWIFTFFCRYS